MAGYYELQDRDTDSFYKGRNLEMVVDDEKDVGEIYLDGNLIFQEVDVFSEDELKGLFKEQFEVIRKPMEDPIIDPEKMKEPDLGKPGRPKPVIFDDPLETSEAMGSVEDEIDEEWDENDPEYQPRLYSKGGEFMTYDDREFIGDYHINPIYGPVIGKFGRPGKLRKEEILLEMDEEDVTAIRIKGKEPAEIIDYTVDHDDDMEFDMEDEELDMDDGGDFY
jgi:hypothetical protein